METNPIIVALLALLALPGATSLAVGFIRRASDALGIHPSAIVYAVSAVLTGVIVVTGGGEALPAFDGSPTAYVAAWLAWATVNARAAEAVYDILRPILAPAT